MARAVAGAPVQSRLCFYRKLEPATPLLQHRAKSSGRAGFRAEGLLDRGAKTSCSGALSIQSSARRTLAGCRRAASKSGPMLASTVTASKRTATLNISDGLSAWVP